PSRREVTTVMWRILVSLTKMLAPVLSFTSEEIWQELKKIDPSQPESVFLADWPNVVDSEIDPDLEENWNGIVSIKGAISRAIEVCRSSGEIGQSLETAVTIVKKEDGVSTLLSNDEWQRIAIVSSFSWVDDCPDAKEDDETGYMIKVSPASGSKCPRCWRFSEDVDDQGLCPRCQTVI
ncbi:MAG: class I tRNA ligase family protein, partial [Dethiosulfovibrio sp.]|nr:class I tRNA ligase family protein [Dethiosulfovibrio sp.]